MASSTPEPVSAAQARALFAPYAEAPALVLAVSGGPDSTALLWLAARWRKTRKRGPELIAVTIDHGLRREGAAEARDVKRLAQTLGIQHVTKRWRGAKPKQGLPAAARNARYRLLRDAAKAAGATHILTAHTLDDQAETVLMRLARGSGLTGLAGMAAETPLGDVTLARPFLGMPKARLVVTLDRAQIAYATDPTNADPAYLRPRLRAVLPALAAEGLDAAAFARFAARMARADAALDAMASAAEGDGLRSAAAFRALPEDIRIRLLQRLIARIGHEGPARLGQIEVLAADLAQAIDRGAPLRRTLGGALIALKAGTLSIAPAPLRRRIAAPRR